MLRCRRGSLVDIGSGDGRIVIAAAKEGFTAVGYELNPWLVWYSRYRAWREGVHGSAKFYISDLWKVTFSQYSNVVIFGVPQMRGHYSKPCSNHVEYFTVTPHRCCSWRKNLNLNLTMMHESLLAGFPSHTGLQTMSLGRG
ncbi:PREDICTED: protein FAM173B isoform X5 [Rhinopithecus bieti]|nr:PREDICTED: protein FAM173B isoform X5 [Rhinopithecus bieti]